MTVFHETARLAVVRLGPDTPLGFFRSLDPQSNATELWVVERNGTKAAIVLKAAEERWRFEAVPLIDEDATAWSGAAMGDVEVRVDLDSGVFSDSLRQTAGCITITGGSVRVAAKVSNRPSERVTFEVGTSAATAETSSGVFSRWQLIQRDHTGAAVVLFQQD